MEVTQKNRQIQVTTPLAPDELLIYRMEAREELGRLFEFTLDLLSENDNIAIDDLLGQKMTVELDLVEGQKRYFDGYVSRFTQVGSLAFFAHYRAVVRPWLWFLSRTSDCRIYQQISVPDIIKEIFRDHSFTDFEDNLNNSYREWEYCVQYRETDLNFVSRLMEQEGIYYYFKHESGKHTLVLCDDYSAHSAIAGYGEIPYYPPSEHGSSRWQEYVYDWKLTKSVQPGRYAHNDFDFTKPKADLHTNAPLPREYAHADYEIYDYPGEYQESADGDGYARSRIAEIQTGYEVLKGEANARGLAVGALFSLKEHARGDQNREYLVTEATHILNSDAFESMPELLQEPVYAVGFSSIASRESFRSARITPKPLVQGPQTAVVVGKSGEEIYTDEYGRVKLQFHWDRYGGSDQNSSCWVRVAQVWSGKNWGGIHIPRMGQEVIVDFLEGDPDRPIITGRVYNADQMPPYGLPGNKTQSGIKSRSSKGGSGDNFNEIRFEDKKGEEQVYVHAEKNQDNLVENDETTSVGHDRTENVGNDETISIGNDRGETVGNNETISIGNNRTETVGSNEDITIGVDRTEKVGSNETVAIGSNRSVTIGSNKTETIAVNKAETIGVAKELTIGAAYQVSVGAAMNETVGASKSMQVGANLSEDIGANKSVGVGANQSTSVGKDDTLKVGKNLVIDAGDSIVIKTGKATISMKKDGTISIQGKDITIKGSGGIDVKASKNITMKGKKILQN